MSKLPAIIRPLFPFDITAVELVSPEVIDEAVKIIPPHREPGMGRWRAVVWDFELIMNDRILPYQAQTSLPAVPYRGASDLTSLTEPGQTYRATPYRRTNLPFMTRTGH